MELLQMISVAMPIIAFLIGQVTPFFIEWLKANPAIKFINADTIKTIKATIVFIGFAVAALDTWLGGGTVDIATLFKAFGDMLIVYMAAYQTYHESVKKPKTE